MTIVACSRDIIIIVTSKHFSKNVKTPGVVIGMCAWGFQKKTFFTRFPLSMDPSSRQKVVPSPMHTSPFRQIKRVSVSGDTATSGNDIVLCARAAVFPRHRPNRCAALTNPILIRSMPTPAVPTPFAGRRELSISNLSAIIYIRPGGARERYRFNLRPSLVNANCYADGCRAPDPRPPFLRSTEIGTPNNIPKHFIYTTSVKIFQRFSRGNELFVFFLSSPKNFTIFNRVLHSIRAFDGRGDGKSMERSSP